MKDLPSQPHNISNPEALPTRPPADVPFTHAVRGEAPKPSTAQGEFVPPSRRIGLHVGASATGNNPPAAKQFETDVPPEVIADKEAVKPAADREPVNPGYDYEYIKREDGIDRQPVSPASAEPASPETIASVREFLGMEPEQLGQAQDRRLDGLQ
jgi:hypothetical protein